ncbi:TetR/AcrR family transcriptional regulator C-terminal domain-containing protein [Nocardia sp. NPDC051030]|uniref:TetR/AcrR family transcriptional regulator n=1 Tax=Nocardia sp. NPDC051030 TaxID=3155162 RepID=UPI00343C4E04
MSLLWRHALPPRPGVRGPKQTLDVDTVVRTAVTIADRDGYDKISIRTVAAELGLRPMSLYTYVPSKEALIVLMVDAVADEDTPISPDLSARERMSAIAHQIRTEILTHPWLLEVPPWRQVLGPGRSRRYERQLEAIDNIGLSDLDMDRTLAILTEFATGNARMAVAATRSAADMTDAQWWEVHGPLLEKVMPADRFPLSSRVGSTAGEVYQAPGDPTGSFEYGLTRLLDGIEAHLA